MFSIRTESLFSNSHLSIHKIFRMAYYWSEHPSSNLEAIMKETEVKAKDTVIDFYNFFHDLQYRAKTLIGHSMANQGFCSVL